MPWVGGWFLRRALNSRSLAPDTPIPKPTFFTLLFMSFYYIPPMTNQIYRVYYPTAMQVKMFCFSSHTKLPSRSSIPRGHSVTTLRFFDPTSPWMASLGANHTDVVLHLNNSDGRLPLVTREEKGAFLLPMDLLWSKGNQQVTSCSPCSYLQRSTQVNGS